MLCDRISFFFQVDSVNWLMVFVVEFLISLSLNVIFNFLTKNCISSLNIQKIGKVQFKLLRSHDVYVSERIAKLSHLNFHCYFNCFLRIWFQRKFTFQISNRFNGSRFATTRFNILQKGKFFKFCNET